MCKDHLEASFGSPERPMIQIKAPGPIPDPPDPAPSGANLLLTGRPGIGKTTALAAAARRLVELDPADLGLDDLGASGLRPGGFVTEEVRRGGVRVGFALVDFGGQRQVMAHRDLVSSSRVGRYGVDVEKIDYVSDLALSARAPVPCYLVDEIGKMECFSRRFVAAVSRLLDDPRPVVATVALGGSGLIAEVKRRADVELWEVTEASRSALPGQILAWLEARLRGIPPTRASAVAP
jgi:nucleoside-triphosphatase